MELFQTLKDNGLNFKRADRCGMYTIGSRMIGKTDFWLYGEWGEEEHVPLANSNANDNSYLFNREIKPIVSKLITLGLDDYNDYKAYQMYEYPTEVKRSNFNLAIKCLRNLKKNNVSLSSE